MYAVIGYGQKFVAYFLPLIAYLMSVFRAL